MAYERRYAGERGTFSQNKKEAIKLYLSEFLPHTGDPYVLKRDGAFALLEQCTRIRGENALTYLENPKYADALRDRNISCLICTPEMEALVPHHVQGLVFSPVPKSVFFHIHNLLVRSRKKWPSQISSSANISEDACIAPCNVIIGEDVEIQPKAIIHENTVIEDHVRICSGAIVGGQSFTAVRDAQGGMYLALDGGSTRIRTGAEICSGAHIACGTLIKDVTEIGTYAKIDALVHIGHGTVIGSQTLIPAGAIVSGNCVIGDHVWIGVNATVSNRIVIEDNARVSLGSVVTQNVREGLTVTGNFAVPHQKFIQNLKASVMERQL